MALYEKRDRMPPYLAEIPYGFKNLWRITVTEYDLQGMTFRASAIQEAVCNGGTVTTAQLRMLYDYNRDGCSLIQSGGGDGMYVTLTGYDVDTDTFAFQTLMRQSLMIDGVLQVTGDMVDNANPQHPVVGHDLQKLDVSVYEKDQEDLNTRLESAESGITANADEIQELKEEAVTSITVNGEPVTKENGTAQIEIAALTPDELAEALDKKVDKDIAGDGGAILQDAKVTIDDEGTLTWEKTALSLQNGAKTPDSASYNLKTILGVDTLFSIDYELTYLVPDSQLQSLEGEAVIPLASLYRLQADGTVYHPVKTDRIQTVFAVSASYSSIGVESGRYLCAVGYQKSTSAETVTCVFTNLAKYTVYQRYNAYRAGTTVYDPQTSGVYYVRRNVPLPSSEAGIIPLQNATYYTPLVDNSLMTPNTIFANFEDTPNPGQDYTVDQARIELMKGETSEFAGYNEYVAFKTDAIPAQIVTEEDWNTHIYLWVTDGIIFTALSGLLDYVGNYQSPKRYKLSNRGIVRTSFESGGLQITPSFDISYIESRLDSVYIPRVTGVSGHLAVLDEDGALSDSGAAVSAFATSAQGEKADSAVQSVALAPGSTDGTVQITVDGEAQEAAVTGLDSAAYQPASAFATATQGARADSAVQSVALSGGTENGTLKLTVTTPDGADTSDNIPVTGLKSAAYQPSSAFATAAQGTRADSAVQSVSLATGTENGTVKLSVNGVETPVSVAGLGSAAYTASTAYATAAQGARADTALQPGSVVDNLSSTSPSAPLSANQGRVLSQRIEAMGAGGKPIGGFETYADRYTNTSQYASDLQPINTGDTIYIAADENHTDMPAQYAVSSIDESGEITYAFVKIVPDAHRDFSLNPIETGEIEPGAIVSSLIASDAVTQNHIAPGAVGETQLDEGIQATLAKAENAVQLPVSSSGSGAVVTEVTQTQNGTLSVSYGNAVTSVAVTGDGDFVTGVSMDGAQLTLQKTGTAIQNVVQSDEGNTVTGIAKDEDGNLAVTRGTRLAGVTSQGTGNVVASLTQNGASIAAQMATMLSSITKSGSGNALTGVSTGAGGAVTLQSGTMLQNVAQSGTGNVVTGVTASGGVITVEKGNVVSSLPSASTSQAGIVQLVDGLTSESTNMALTARAGARLQTAIQTVNSAVVHLDGSETVTGTKTFTAHIIVPQKTTLPVSPSATRYATEAQVATRYAKVANAGMNNLLAVGTEGELFDTGVPYTAIGDATISQNTATTLQGILKGANGVMREAVPNEDYTAAAHLTDEDAHATLFGNKQNAITASGVLKGDGAGNVTAAEAGVDYVAAAHLTDTAAHSTLFAGKLSAPSPTTADEGKFLRVVSGIAAWATVPSAEGEAF